MSTNEDVQRRHPWLGVPTTIDKAAGIAFVRIFIGLFWLFEVTVGHNWKLGSFGTGRNPDWFGPNAGQEIRDNVAGAAESGTWPWVTSIFESVVIPNAAAFGYFVTFLQVAFGLAFIFGFMVRPIALVALGFDLSLYFLGTSRIPPFFTAAHLFILATNAGMYYGFDGWLTQRLGTAREGGAAVLHWLMNLPILTHHLVQKFVIAASVVLAWYFAMEIVARPGMQMVAVELMLLFGFIAAGVAFVRMTGDTLGVVAALLRVFVGFKFLHEIVVRTGVAQNGLPGAPNSTALEEFLTTTSANHWPVFSWVVDTFFLSAVGFWALVFFVVQLLVGIALIIGFQTRIASLTALAYLAVLMTIGFDRYAPFVFGLAVGVYVLDAGRRLSLDSERVAETAPRYGLPVPERFVYAGVILAAVNGIAAIIAITTQGGVIPDGYVADLGAMTTAMWAMFSLAFAAVGWMQLRSTVVRPATTTRDDVTVTPVPAA
jgi:hypothetical protein